MSDFLKNWSHLLGIKLYLKVSEIAAEKLKFEFSEDNAATNENPVLDSQEANDITELSTQFRELQKRLPDKGLSTAFDYITFDDDVAVWKNTSATD